MLCRPYTFRSALLSVRAMLARSLGCKAYAIGQDVGPAAIHTGGDGLSRLDRAVSTIAGSDLGGRYHNGSEMMLIAPWRKDSPLIRSSLGSGDLPDISHAKRPQLANLPCLRIFVRHPPLDELRTWCYLSVRPSFRDQGCRRPS